MYTSYDRVSRCTGAYREEVVIKFPILWFCRLHAKKFWRGWSHIKLNIPKESGRTGCPRPILTASTFLQMDFTSKSVGFFFSLIKKKRAMFWYFIHICQHKYWTFVWRRHRLRTWWMKLVQHMFRLNPIHSTAEKFKNEPLFLRSH